MYDSYLPSSVQLLFTRRNIAYSMRASHDLERQSVCSTMRAMSLCVKGVQVWNYICDDLKTVNTFAAFKRKCKNLIFKKYLVVDHLSNYIYMSRCLLMLCFVYEFVTSI